MAVSSDIESKATNIRQQIKGKDVREALASGIEAIDVVTEDTKARQDTVEADFVTIQQSEATRVLNEQTRQNNEEIRQTNEAARENSENTRATNEETRQSQETVRQENETSRQSVIDAMKVLEGYDNNKEYKQFNKVVYQGSTYECATESVTGVCPNSDALKWLCIAQKGQDGQGGDMFKSVYDTDKSGIVDNAEKLGGQPPDYYVKVNDFTSHKEDSMYQVATGTATAIIISTTTLTNGYAKTFIASANNSSAATTINGKNLYKPNTTIAPNLIVGKAYTVWYDSGKDCFFIKASAEGNTIADHVLAGDTFSNDNNTGLVGSMDLQASNIKKGITYGGIIGTLPSLPQEYVGKRLLLSTTIDASSYVTASNDISFTLDGDTLFYSSNIPPYNTYKYDVLTKQLTNLGHVGTPSDAICICCSDDGSVIYVEDNYGNIYYWGGSSWISTGQMAQQYGTAITCNPDGSELYFIWNSGTGTILKKWVKATGNVTAIYSLDNLRGYVGALTYVDDYSLWVGVNSGNGMLAKISLYTGVNLKTVTSPYVLNSAVMYRKSTLGDFGSFIAYAYPNYYLYRIMNDCTVSIVAGVYESTLVGSKTGKYQAAMTGSTVVAAIYNVANSPTPLVSNIPTTSTIYALSEDYSRWYEQKVLKSNYLYQ